MSPNNNSIKSFNDKIKDLTKKLDDIEQGHDNAYGGGEQILSAEEQEIQDRERYQASKKEYQIHDTNGIKCSRTRCLLECDYFPEDGIETEDGEIFYDDPNLSSEFWGSDNALETRKKVAAMSPKPLEKYKQSLKHEYTEETKKAIAEGKRLYVRSGSYPTHDDPVNNPNSQFYEYVGDK